MEIPTGPATLAEVEWLSSRSSWVQMDLLSLQLAAARSVMLIRSFPSGLNSPPSCSKGMPSKRAVSGATYRFRIVPVAIAVPRSAPEGSTA